MVIEAAVYAQLAKRQREKRRKAIVESYRDPHLDKMVAEFGEICARLRGLPADDLERDGLAKRLCEISRDAEFVCTPRSYLPASQLREVAKAFRGADGLILSDVEPISAYRDRIRQRADAIARMADAAAP